jgi:Zn-dependent protease with chaperone function
MIATVRAAIAIMILASIYLFALIVVLALLSISFILIFGLPLHFVRDGAEVAYGALLVGVAVVVAARVVARVRPNPPSGYTLDRCRAPELWAIVGELAGRLGTREPDEIRVIPDVNAAVSEQTTMSGLRGGRIYLIVGLPLLQAMTVQQLRSVLAHELAHYSRRHNHLAALTYRGRMTIMQVIEQLQPTPSLAWLFSVYARLYFFVESAVGRSQELEADRYSVQEAGKQATLAALRETQLLVATWEVYLDNYLRWGWEAGYAPAEVFGGYRQWLNGGSDDITGLRRQAPEPRRPRWDSHPAIDERVAAICVTPDSAVPSDPRPATELLPNLDKVVEMMDAMLTPAGRTVLTWDDFTAAACTAVMQGEANVVLRMVARISGRRPVTFEDLLDLLDTGRRDKLATALFPRATVEDARQQLLPPLGILLELAAVRSGVAHWQHSWSGPPALLYADGSPFDAHQLVDHMLTSQDMSPVRRRLADMGVDLAAATLTEEHPTAKTAEVLAGITNLIVDDEKCDLLILYTGLLVLPLPHPRPKDEDGRRQLRETAQSMSPDQLVALDYNYYLPLEEVVETRRTRSRRMTFEVLKINGNKVRIRDTIYSKQIGAGYHALGHMMHLYLK